MPPLANGYLLSAAICDCEINGRPACTGDLWQDALRDEERLAGVINNLEHFYWTANTVQLPTSHPEILRLLVQEAFERGLSVVHIVRMTIDLQESVKSGSSRAISW